MWSKKSPFSFKASALKKIVAAMHQVRIGTQVESFMACAESAQGGKQMEE